MVHLPAIGDKQPFAKAPKLIIQGDEFLQENE